LKSPIATRRGAVPTAYDWACLKPTVVAAHEPSGHRDNSITASDLRALDMAKLLCGGSFERKRGRCPMLGCYQSPRTFCHALSGLIFRRYLSCLNCEDAGEAGTVLQHQRGENRTSLPRIVVIDDMKSRSANWGSVLENLDGVGTGTVRVHCGRPGKGLV